MPINSNQRIAFYEQPKTEQYYDQTTPNLQVIAKPLNMPVDDSELIKLNQQSKQSANFWNNLTNTANVGLQLYSKIDAENKRKAQLEAQSYVLKGITPDEKASKDVWDTYYKTLGAKEVNDYYTSLSSYIMTQKADWNDPEDLQSAMNEFTQQWIKERPSNDSYLEGFLPKALEIQEQLQSNLFENKIKQRQEEILNTAVSKVYQTADDTLNKFFKTELGASITTVASDPKILTQGLPTDALNQIQRATLSKVQEDVKPFGFTRLEASQLYVTAIGELAAAYGLPELLDFTGIKDESGISLDSTLLKDKIEEYRTKALKTKEIKIEELSKQDEAYKKQWLDTSYKKTYQALDSLQHLAEIDPVQARAKAEELKETLMKEDSFVWGLDNSKFEKIIKMVDEVAYDTSTFPGVSNSQAYVSFREKALNGELNLDELYENKDKFSKEDFTELQTKVIAHSREVQDQNRQYFVNELKAKGMLEEFNLQDIKDLVTKGLITPKEQEEFLNLYVKQEQAKELPGAASSAASKQKLKQQEDTYIQLYTQFSTGQKLPTQETKQEIYEMYANGQLNATQTKDLINRIDTALTNAQKESQDLVYGKFSPTIEGLRTTLKSSLDPQNPYTIFEDETVKLQLSDILYQMEDEFRKKFGTQASYEDYVNNVYKPIQEVIKHYQETQEIMRPAINMQQSSTNLKQLETQKQTYTAPGTVKTIEPDKSIENPLTQIHNVQKEALTEILTNPGAVIKIPQDFSLEGIQNKFLETFNGDKERAKQQAIYTTTLSIKQFFKENPQMAKDLTDEEFAKIGFMFQLPVEEAIKLRNEITNLKEK